MTSEVAVRKNPFQLSVPVDNRARAGPRTRNGQQRFFHGGTPENRRICFSFSHQILHLKQFFAQTSARMQKRKIFFTKSFALGETHRQSVSHGQRRGRSEEHTSELQSQSNL